MAMSPDTKVRPNDLYDRDFYAWTKQQAELLRDHRFDDLDLVNLIEEIASVGRSDKREIESRLTVLIAHLLKWKFQPGMRSNGWSGTIREQRRRIARIVADSPSLAAYPTDLLDDVHLSARLAASTETGIAFDVFPESCPFTMQEILDAAFLPEPPSRP